MRSEILDIKKAINNIKEQIKIDNYILKKQQDTTLKKEARNTFDKEIADRLESEKRDLAELESEKKLYDYLLTKKQEDYKQQLLENELLDHFKKVIGRDIEQLKRKKSLYNIFQALNTKTMLDTYTDPIKEIVGNDYNLSKVYHKAIAELKRDYGNEIKKPTQKKNTLLNDILINKMINDLFKFCDRKVGRW